MISPKKCKKNMELNFKEQLSLIWDSLFLKNQSNGYLIRITNVVGERPNFMKIAPLMRTYKQYNDSINPVLVHTGQHYDPNMSENFLKELDIPRPRFNLNIGSGSQGSQGVSYISGTSGTAGSAGSSGSQGSSGESGTAGGTSGTSSSSGSSGSTGSDGSSGSLGEQGYSYGSGTSATSGSSGSDGSVGEGGV